MPVVEILTFEVKPGRMAEFVDEVRQLRGILERVDTGLTSVRLLRVVVAGPDSGRVALMVENTDLAAWGQSLENESVDPEEQALGARLYGPDSPVTQVRRELLREVVL